MQTKLWLTRQVIILKKRLPRFWLISSVRLMKALIVILLISLSPVSLFSHNQNRNLDAKI